MISFANCLDRVRRERDHIVTPRTAWMAAALFTAAVIGPIGVEAQGPTAGSRSVDEQRTGSAAVPAVVPAPPALVLVVRHAEKVDNSDDPALSETGIARATALGAALRAADVDHVIVTHRQRTRLTASDVIDARSLDVEVIPFGRSMSDHVAAVAAAAMRQSGKVVLIVGHSNTVPAIVHALGGPRLPDLCDASYATLFSVVPAAAGGSTRVVISSFGAADPPGASDCAGMVPR